MNEYETSALFIKNKSVPEIAALYRRLCGLELAVQMMGFDPKLLADFALSEHDQMWVHKALQALPYGVLRDEGQGDAKQELGVSEAGLNAIREMLQMLRLTKKTQIHVGNFQAAQA